MSNKTEFFEVRVAVRGTKKRCRKVDLHGFNLLRVPLTVKVNADEMRVVEDVALDLVLREMKTYDNYQINFTYGYDEEGSDFTKTFPFDDKNFSVIGA